MSAEESTYQDDSVSCSSHSSALRTSSSSDSYTDKKCANVYCKVPSHKSVKPKTRSKPPGTNRLLCREEQHDFVKQFLVYSLVAEVSRSLYISGDPGTGKTATVNQVVGELSSTENLPDFQFIEVNGMRLSDPNQVFVEIYRELRKVQDRLESVALVPRVSVEAARRSLNELFDRNDPLRMPVVLLVDELDLLQHVLFELFDWATRDTARCKKQGVTYRVKPHVPEQYCLHLHMHKYYSKLLQYSRGELVGSFVLAFVVTVKGVAELKLQEVIIEYYILSNLDGYRAVSRSRQCDSIFHRARG